MEEFELSEVTEHEQELEPAELEPATVSICWYCWETIRVLDGVNTSGKPICWCKCTDNTQFIHIDCIEIYANTFNRLRCQYCYVRYPLELKRKSLLECYRKRNTLPWLHRKIFMFVFHLFIAMIATVFCFDSLWIFIYSNSTLHPAWNMRPFFIIACLIYILHSIYATVSMTTNWSRRYCYKPYDSTEELELREQNLIQETEL